MVMVLSDSLNIKLQLMKTFLEPVELRSLRGTRVLSLSCSNIEQMVNLPSKSLHKLSKFSGLSLIFQPLPNFFCMLGKNEFANQIQAVEKEGFCNSEKA